MTIIKDKSIFGKFHLLTKNQKEIIKNPSTKYVKIFLVDCGKKNERFYVSHQKEGYESDGIYDVQTIKPFIS